MKYQCIRGYSVGGKPVKVGDVLDLTDDEAAIPMWHGKIIPFADDAVQTRDPVVDHREPVVTRPGRKPRGR